MPRDPLHHSGSCWECDAATAHPMTVSLTTTTQIIGALTLSPDCYMPCYLPLDLHPVDPDG